MVARVARVDRVDRVERTLEVVATAEDAAGVVEDEGSTVTGASVGASAAVGSAPVAAAGVADRDACV